MAVLVPILESLLVDMPMGVDVVAVTVLVLVGDMSLLEIGARMLVHRAIGVLVVVGVHVLTAMLLWRPHPRTVVLPGGL